jgi:hypothetical protein
MALQRDTPGEIGGSFDLAAVCAKATVRDHRSGDGRQRAALRICLITRGKNGPGRCIHHNAVAPIRTPVARLVHLLQEFTQAARARSTPVFNVKKELETEGVV